MAAPSTSQKKQATKRYPSVKRYIERENLQIKFAPPTPAEKPIRNMQLGIEAERKNLERLDILLFKNYICAIEESQANIAFAKKFYPKRLSLLVSLILSIVMSKNLPNGLKYSALKFFHENFDIDEALIDKILAELDAIEAVHYPPFSNFNIEDDLDGYGLYNFSQDERIEFVPTNSLKENALAAIANLKKHDKVDKDNENLDRRLVIKPNPQMRMHDEEEFFDRPGVGSQQNLPENSPPSSFDPYKILEMEPKHINESEKDFQRRVTISFRRLALKRHPDKEGGTNEAFQELDRAYKGLMDGSLLRENETARQNSPSRRPA